MSGWLSVRPAGGWGVTALKACHVGAHSAPLASTRSADRQISRLPSSPSADLSPSEPSPFPLQGALEVCHALLRFAVQHSVDAIIDCGALLAGTTNR